MVVVFQYVITQPFWSVNVGFTDPLQFMRDICTVLDKVLVLCLQLVT